MTHEELLNNLLERLDRLEQKPDPEAERAGLRDYFAANSGVTLSDAMQSMGVTNLRETTYPLEVVYARLAKMRLNAADAMLKARESEAA